MASISVGKEHGKRALDSEIPLVPFIDLLLCCVMFLLVTAVWNELSQVKATQQTPGPQTDALPAPPPTDLVVLSVGHAGYVLASPLGDRTEIPKAGNGFDNEGLARALADRHRLAPDSRRVELAAEDGVPYVDVLAAMDVAIGHGFADVDVSGTPL
jgi:biopolymer transport protein ExbD